MVFKWFILFAVFWVTEADERACEIDVAKIKNLVDKATAFRARYDFGMQNQNQSDPKIKEKLSNSCIFFGDSEWCRLEFMIRNSTFSDFVKISYNVGDRPDQITDAIYFRTRGNKEDTWNIEWDQTRGFIVDDFEENGTTIDLHTRQLVGDIDDMMSRVTHLSEDDQDVVRDMYNAVQRALNFYDNLSDEYKKILFRSYYNRNENSSSVHTYKLLETGEHLYFETRADGSQFGQFRCDKSDDPIPSCVVQNFDIDSGNVVLSKKPIAKCHCYTSKSYYAD